MKHPGAALTAALVLAGAAALAAPTLAATHGAHPGSATPAPVPQAIVQPKSPLPAPGSYRLEHIMQAPAGVVLDTRGAEQPLARYTTGRITVLSFIYTRCSDAKGCPYAYLVYHLLKGELDADPALRDRVRLVSLSFDPVNDSPEVMRRYGAGQAAAGSDGVPWEFLTTSGPGAVVPLLDGFGQDVSVVSKLDLGAGAHDHGAALHDAEFSHVLKVFLIDAAGSIREIYTTSFLQPQMVMNDIRTLAMETDVTSQK